MDSRPCQQKRVPPNPSRGRPTAGFAHCRPPLMSHVRHRDNPSPSRNPLSRAMSVRRHRSESPGGITLGKHAPSRKARIRSSFCLKFKQEASFATHDEECIQLEAAALLLPASYLHLSRICWVPASVRASWHHAAEARAVSAGRTEERQCSVVSASSPAPTPNRVARGC